MSSGRSMNSIRRPGEAMRISQPLAIYSICSLLGPLSIQSIGRPRAVHEIDQTTGKRDEDIAAFGKLFHVLLVGFPSELLHSPATKTGRAHLSSSPRIDPGST
ncbi:hypothetical protein B0H65DRAFT_465142 [Neurospora tetraspora]|uniref:Uncharacterized protein n=1 Tax=Neurospora tetraspora TaxID=94610 RepID=A0AAE0JFD6_9PEZI|nr:hypothetical protein B0H65DRAFT_465142 [Neurospora tetraspora]